jgi:hypothetical protein
MIFDKLRMSFGSSILFRLDTETDMLEFTKCVGIISNVLSVFRGWG